MSRASLALGLTCLLAADAIADSASVEWQYYADDGKKIGKQLPATRLQCSVVSTDKDGEWICLYLAPIPKTDLGDHNADSCRAIDAKGKPFELPAGLRPDAQVTQVVAFYSGSGIETYILNVDKDGQIGFYSLSPSFNGTTEIVGAVSVTWFKAKNP